MPRSGPLTPRRAQLLAAALALASACSRPDPERELREAVAAMARAVVDKDVAAFLEYVSEDFVRESGVFDRNEVRRRLVANMLRHDSVQVIATVTEVKLDGERARATVRVLATGGRGWIPERADGWEFRTAWKREGGRWRVFAAEWRD